MTKPVDDIFLHEVDQEDSLDVMIGSGYDDIIDLIADGEEELSIFDSDDDDEEEPEDDDDTTDDDDDEGGNEDD